MDKKWYETERHKIAEKALEDFSKIVRVVVESQGSIPRDPTPEMKEPLLIIKDYVVEKANIYKDFDYLSPDLISLTMNKLRSIVWRWLKPIEMTPEERESILMGGHSTVEGSLRQMARDTLLGKSEALISSGFFLTKEQTNEFIRYVHEEEEYFRENNPELYKDFSINYNKESFFQWVSMLAPLTEETIIKYREHLSIMSIVHNSDVDRTPSVDLLIDTITKG